MNEWILSLGSVRDACLANALYFIASYSIGQITIRHLWKKDKLTDSILSLLIGSNIITLLFFLLSVFGGVKYFPPFYFLISSTIPLIFNILKKNIKCIKPEYIRKIWIQIKLNRETIKIHYPIIILLIILFLFAGASLSYPIGWDEMVYHQSIVQRWISDGFPAFYIDLPYSAFPSLNSFSFWMLVDTGGIIAPRLFIWCCWVITLLILYKIINLYALNGFKAMMLVIAFALSKTMLIVVSDAYVETLILMNAAGIFLILADGFSKTEITQKEYCKTAVLCGILAGGAASIKLTGIIVFLVPILWFYFSSNVKYRKKILLFTGLFLIIGLLFTLPFYLRPWLTTGNPFYPYFCHFFSNSQAQLEMSSFHHKIGSARFGVKSIAMFFAAPFALAFNSKIFDGAFGWQFLIIFILFLINLITEKTRKNLFWGSIALLLYIFWFFSAQQARFLLPVIFIIYMGAALTISNLQKIRQIIAITLISILTLLSMPFKDSGYYYCSWAQLAGKITLLDFLHTGTGGNFLQAIDAITNLTPEDATLMVLFEHRILYFPRKTLIATPYFQEKFFTPVESYSTSEKILKAIHNSKADYLLVAMHSEGPDELPEYLKKDKQFILVLSRLAQKGQMKEIWRSSRYSLFKIKQ